MVGVLLKVSKSGGFVRIVASYDPATGEVKSCESDEAEARGLIIIEQESGEMSGENLSKCPACRSRTLSIFPYGLWS